MVQDSVPVCLCAHAVIILIDRDSGRDKHPKLDLNESTAPVIMKNQPN